HGCECTCADFVFNRDGKDPEGCKHIRALTVHGLLTYRSGPVLPRVEDAYGDMPRRVANRGPLAPPSSLHRGELAEFVRGCDSDDTIGGQPGHDA
ncbi:hypothetical protein ACYOEI_18120, partial [Singulisphaera rosea]